MQTIKIIIFQVAELSALQKLELHKPKLDNSQGYIFKY
jgi:hypothetical protein